MGQKRAETAADEWVSFPGNELEGKRPKALCPACREALQRRAVNGGSRSAAATRTAKPLCFACYRAELQRERTLKAAGELNTASEARFQFQLPFEPVNRPRLEMLRADRATQRLATPPHTDRRRHAQIEARHALQTIVTGLRARGLPGGDIASRERAIFTAVHAAELQLPESWLPFVMAR